MNAPSHTATSDSQPRVRGSVDAITAVASILAVLIGTAVCLRLIDELPGAAVGVARGVRRLDSIEAVVESTGRRMPLPAYFPDTIAWPPADVLVYGGSSASVAFRHRTSTDNWLIVATAGSLQDVPAALLPAAIVLQSAPTTLRNHPATAERLRDLNGVLWHQLTWHEAVGARLVRYRGTLDDLELIAGSMGERGK